jgi:nucleoside-diphosphate-sugar epimerase
MYANYYFTRYKLPVVKARFQNVYGPREILGAGQWRGTPHSVWRNVTPTFIWKSLNKEALTLDNEGRSSRDFIFVEDMAEGLMRCALAGEPGGVYNLASGKETTIAELAQMVNEVTGNHTPSEMRPARDWDRSGKRFGCTQKSERELGFVAKTNLNEGIKQTVEWTIQHTSLIELAIAKHDAKMTAS